MIEPITLSLWKWAVHMEILPAVVLYMPYKLLSRYSITQTSSQQFLFLTHILICCSYSYLTVLIPTHSHLLSMQWQNYLRARLNALKTHILYLGLGPPQYNQPQWFPWAAGLQLHQPEVVHSRGMKESEDRNLISCHCLKTKQTKRPLLGTHLQEHHSC